MVNRDIEVERVLKESWWLARPLILVGTSLSRNPWSASHATYHRARPIRKEWDGERDAQEARVRVQPVEQQALDALATGLQVRDERRDGRVIGMLGPIQLYLNAWSLNTSRFTGHTRMIGQSTALRVQTAKV